MHLCTGTDTAMSVCAFAADEVTEDEAANYKSAAETPDLTDWTDFRMRDIETYLAQMMHLRTGVLESWKSVKDELGAYYFHRFAGSGKRWMSRLPYLPLPSLKKQQADVALTLDMSKQAYTAV